MNWFSLLLQILLIINMFLSYTISTVFHFRSSFYSLKLSHWYIQITHIWSTHNRAWYRTADVRIKIAIKPMCRNSSRCWLAMNKICSVLPYIVRRKLKIIVCWSILLWMVCFSLSRGWAFHLAYTNWRCQWLRTFS